MENLEEFGQELLRETVRVTKASNTLPQVGDEYEYYCSFNGFKIFNSKVGDRLKQLIHKLLLFEGINSEWVNDNDDHDELFDVLVEANDSLLEKVSSLLDEGTTNRKGIVKMDSNNNADVASWNRKETVLNIAGSGNIPRPQAKFRDMVDNSCSPFIPVLFSKPNQLNPLPNVFNELQAPTSLQTLIENSKKWSQTVDRCAHPYLYEIQMFEPTDLQMNLSDPISPDPLDDTPLMIITTCNQLTELISVLSSVTEFAVDLEHHSYRSFQGFVCLMQISTRTTDYIIDTLELRHEMQAMNTVFTDPKIVKVFHGADWDVCWLQRDFGIYVVNMFDTGQASRVLQLPKYSLAFLLDYCCQVKADKQYQLADWRIRPLPHNMIKYAREDTHYLLFIYDRMANELIRRSNVNNNMLISVIDRSRNIAMKTYERPIYHEDDYLKLCHKFKRSLNKHQLACVSLLYHWRDQLARQEDESTGYVLPNHMLFQISEVLPREPQGILACCNPVPTILRQHLNEVFTLIEQARSLNTEGTAAMTVTVTVAPKQLTEIRADQTRTATATTTTATTTTTTTTTTEFSRQFNININNVNITSPTLTSIIKCERVMPVNVGKHFDNTEMKFKNILGMYQPVQEMSSVDSQVTSNINTSLEAPSPSIIKKTVVKHSRTLIDNPKERKPIKRPRVDSNTDFTPFEYNPQGFSKAVQDKCNATQEFYPKSKSSKNPTRRSAVKRKSTKSITITIDNTKSNNYQWPT